MTPEGLVAVTQILLLAIVLLAVRAFAAKDGFATAKVMVISVFGVVYPLSSLAHLYGDGNYRGHFDLLSGSALVSRESTLLLSTLIVVLGLASFLVGSRSRHLVRKEQVHSSPPLKLWIGACSLPLAILGAWGLYKVGAAVDGFDAARITELSGGAARYAFLSHWTAWGITLGACWMLGTQSFRSSFRAFLVLSIAVPLIFLCFTWTGGRSIGVVFALPLVLLSYRRLGVYKWLFFIAGAAAVALYVLLVTILRRKGFDHEAFSLVEALDWEFGRFSMIGFAVESSKISGHLFGETLLAGPYQIASAVWRLFGGVATSSSLQSVTQYTGQQLLGSSDKTYIVPGLLAELFLNFSWLGVILGCFVLGRICRLVDRIKAASPDFSQQLLLTYVSVLLALCFVNAHSAAFIDYVFYSGFPLLALWVAEKWLKRTNRRGI